ncbi:TlpA family protein disulfide reductase [Pedobacter borealis]|uniref:TlpA family protein disulfide reductase n=1 Tax=Pedobacter borealis TaxID=475254 RepID=UPI000492EB51|nr:TlpA disulfide reductase family protein [Pedobacter borealis]
MIHKITLKFLLALCCLHLSSYSQNKDEYVTFSPISQVSPKSTFELQIGDKVPQDFWTQKHFVFEDGKKKEFTFQHLKGKIIIIDFWATSCFACIKEMPEQLNLEKKFTSYVKIVKVTSQEEKPINDFFISSKNPLGIELKSIIGDLKLKVIFPYRFIPHMVWIDKNGVVAAFTDGTEVTEKNLHAIINGPFGLPKKIDMRPDVPTYMDWVPATAQAISMLYKGNVPGLNSGNEYLSIEGKTRFFVKNLALQWIYQSLAMNKYDWAGKGNRIMLRFNDKDGQFTNPTFSKDKEWTLDFWIPDSQRDSLASYGIRFLNQYSGYFASAEKIKAACYVLKYNPTNGKSLITTGGKQLVKPLIPPYRIVNAPLKYMISRIVDGLAGRKFELTIPIIDETGFIGNVDIDLLSATNSIEELNLKLKIYGLSLERTEKILDMLVIDKI